ncbi:B12-binding domain-containing radical SAM protein [Rhodoplanes sp. Z2-YC6860]|uniref:B12-binding domain-containing radical SAM protein n=1 Tax=Rhodoplanes sp. Z2-YC6860 TaxID=674703 RepID=UPI00078B99F2|nr:radical SAM protein [Rhodoplanes sp. Z2-YC6860]AMN43783.1 radical SAM protein [Rhodoplanes sp. Z2-YC6860]
MTTPYHRQSTSLEWNEPAVRDALRVLADRSRSICLVTPPSAFLLDERVFVSLGILKVAASLEAQRWRVNLLDLSGVENFLSPLEDYLASCQDVAIGITATTPQLPAVIQIANTIRRLRPDLRLILGGPHVTLIYSAQKLEKKRNGLNGRGHRSAAQLEAIFDVLCSGDGELAIFEALKDDPPKVIDGDDPKGGLFLTDAMFTESPLPARHLVDLKSYHYSIEGHRATSLIAQLGCPFGCGFCGGRNSKSLRQIRNRSVESILFEVENLHRDHGYTGFMFYDDELNVSKSFVELMDGLSDLQSRLGTEFRLRGFVKSELFTLEQAIAMRRAGFRWLLCGFEAAHERILVNIDKRAKLADNDRCVGYAKQAGLKVKALMSCGHPGESEETVTAIRDWLIRNRVDDFDCTVITTYPGTPYYDLAVPHPTERDVWTYTHPKTGDRLHAREVDYTVCADYYKGDPNGGYRSFVYTDHLSAEQLVSLRDMVERDVRKTLNIPFNAGAPAIRYEHSMGQGLPDFIHRTGKTNAAAEAAAPKQIAVG